MDVDHITKPLIVFIIPGHGQSFEDYKLFTWEVAKSFAKDNLKAEFYLFDFLE